MIRKCLRREKIQNSVYLVLQETKKVSEFVQRYKRVTAAKRMLKQFLGGTVKG